MVVATVRLLASLLAISPGPPSMDKPSQVLVAAASLLLRRGSGAEAAVRRFLASKAQCDFWRECRILKGKFDEHGVTNTVCRCVYIEPCMVCNVMLCNVM